MPAGAEVGLTFNNERNLVPSMVRIQRFSELMEAQEPFRLVQIVEDAVGTRAADRVVEVDPIGAFVNVVSSRRSFKLTSLMPKISVIGRQAGVVPSNPIVQVLLDLGATFSGLHTDELKRIADGGRRGLLKLSTD